MLDSCKRSSFDFDAKESKKISSFKETLPQLIAVSIKNLLLISYGMTLGFPTLLVPSVQHDPGNSNSTGNPDLQFNKEEVSWLSSINLICVPLGCLFSGSFTEPIGRRKAMQLVNVPLTVAWLLFYFSTNVNYLYVGLCLTGLSGGLLEAPVLTYVAEITTPAVRGMLAATGSFCVILGVFVVFLLGVFFKWRAIALYSCLLPLTAFILLFFVPESPHWLIRKKRVAEAQKNLAWLRGWVPIKQVEKEFKDLCSLLIVDHQDSSKDAKQSLCSNARNYGRRSFLLPYFIISFCFFVGHFSGMTTLQTYAVQIFQILKAPIDRYYATMLLGVVELTGTLVYVVLVHFTGKKPLVFLSTIGCGACFLATAGYVYFTDLIPMDHLLMNATEILEPDVFTNSSSYKPPTAIPDVVLDHYLMWLPLALMLGSAFISHVGIRLIPWMLIGEIYPSAVRSSASGISGGTGYIFGFLANKMFIDMLEAMTLPGLFLFYAMVSFVGFIVMFFILQETENRTLADIELHYTGKRSLNAKPAKVKASDPMKSPMTLDVANWESNKKFEKHLQKCIESRKIPEDVQSAVGLGKSGVRPSRKSVATMGTTGVEPVVKARSKKYSMNLGLLAGGATNHSYEPTEPQNTSFDTKL